MWAPLTKRAGYSDERWRLGASPHAGCPVCRGVSPHLLSRVVVFSLVRCCGSFGADYIEIMKTLRESQILEVDEDNETIRLKHNATNVRTISSQDHHHHPHDSDPSASSEGTWAVLSPCPTTKGTFAPQRYPAVPLPRE
jgi:hypothetical protein